MLTLERLIAEYEMAIEAKANSVVRKATVLKELVDLRDRLQDSAYRSSFKDVEARLVDLERSVKVMVSVIQSLKNQ